MNVALDHFFFVNGGGQHRARGELERSHYNMNMAEKWPCGQTTNL